MFIGRKEFLDTIKILKAQIETQREINDTLTEEIVKLKQQLESLTSMIALNTIEKLMVAIAQGRAKTEKTTKKVKTQKGSKKKPCSK